MIQYPDADRAVLRAVLALLCAAGLVALLVAVPGGAPALADTDESDDAEGEDADEDDQQTPGEDVVEVPEGEEAEVDVDREAYYVQDISEALPPALTDEFPPALVCLLQPQVCSAEAAAVTGPIDGIISGIRIPSAPLQPVAPGSLPVGMLGGQEAYTSNLRFDLPAIPDDQELATAVLVVDEATPLVSFESPAFRRIVVALIAQIADDPSPQPFIEAITDVLTMDAELATRDFPGLEVCAVTDLWDTGDNQAGAGQPGRDCILGGTGVQLTDGRWAFDITFAAQSWASGEVTNEGLVIAPLDAPNLEFGDPDYSTNFLISFGGSDASTAAPPALIFTTQEAPEDLPDFEDDDVGDVDVGDDDLGDDVQDDVGDVDVGGDDVGDDEDDDLGDGDVGDDDLGDGDVGDEDLGDDDLGDADPGDADGDGVGDQPPAPAPPPGGGGGGGGGGGPGLPDPPAPEVADPPEVAGPEEPAAGGSDEPEPEIAQAEPDPEPDPDAEPQPTAVSDPASQWYLWLLAPLGLTGLWWYATVTDVAPAAGATRRGGALSRLTNRG